MLKLNHLDMDQNEQTQIAIALKDEYSKINMEKLIRSFWKFIQKSCNHYANKLTRQYSKFVYEDLQSVAIDGLFRAVKRYDYKKCDNFWVYGKMWITAVLRIYQMKHISLIHMDDTRFRKIFYKLGKYSGMSFEDQAVALGVSQDDLQAFIQAVKPAKNLLKARKDDPDQSEEEYLTENGYSRGVPNPEELLNAKRILMKVSEVSLSFSEELTEREQNVWKDVLAKQPNYQAVADSEGISRERVRQIASALKEKFKRRLEKNGISAAAYRSLC